MTIDGKNIFVVGITGGIGSGKTEVCKVLEECGIPIFYADDVSKHLADTSASVRRALKKILGPTSYQTDGTLNRSFVASKIFSDAELKKKVESVLHPAVRRERTKFLHYHVRHEKRMAGVEAALIYEAGIDKDFDAIVVVEADEGTRMQRLQRRDGVNRERVQARIAHQAPTRIKVQKADYVLYNDGSLSALHRQVEFLNTLFKAIVKESSTS